MLLKVVATAIYVDFIVDLFVVVLCLVAVLTLETAKHCRLQFYLGKGVVEI